MRDRPDSEVEITREMVEAGLRAYRANRALGASIEPDDDDKVIRIFRVMMRAAGVRAALVAGSGAAYRRRPQYAARCGGGGPAGPARGWV